MDDILTILEHERQVLTALVDCSRRQQKALVGYRPDDAELCAREADELNQALKQSEDMRLRRLMAMLNITRRQAMELSLSELAERADTERRPVVLAMREQMTPLVSELQQLTLLNRVLANRAKSGIQEILSMFTDGTVRICNTRV